MENSAGSFLSMRSVQKTTRTLMLQTVVGDPVGNRVRRCCDAETEKTRPTGTRAKTARIKAKRKTRRGRVPPRRITAVWARIRLEGHRIVGVAVKLSLIHKNGERAKGGSQEVAKIPQRAQKAHQAPCKGVNCKGFSRGTTSSFNRR